jgi:phage terminase large subunit GpA-like protein
LHYSKDFSVVHYQCAGPDCDVLIEEYHKGEMLNGEWRAHAEGDGETVGFHLNALYSPLGWMDWKSLAKQFEKAKKAQAKGDLEPMQVFYNTRLAKVWDAAQEQTKADVLRARARLECFGLGSLPSAVLMITGSVDVQANRLEFMAMGWGVGMERWVVDYQVVSGDPADERTWAALDELLKLSTAIRAASAWAFSPWPSTPAVTIPTRSISSAACVAGATCSPSRGRASPASR